MRSRELGLSWRFLLRDWRSGELWLLVASLLLAVAVSTAIALFSDRLQLAMGRQVAEVLGADMMIRSPKPVKDNLLEQAEAQGLALSQVLEFPSVVMAGDEMHMVSAKAVDNRYPLRGHIRISDQPFGDDRIVDDVPGPGEVWLEPRLFPLLKVRIGDSVLLGEARFKVTKAITLETDRGGDFYSFSPRLMFNQADVDKTGIIQPGSRVTWKTLLAGDAEQLSAFERWAESRLQSSEKLVLANDSRRELRQSVLRLKQFLGLTSLAAILLAGIAIAMASRRFVERRFDHTAIMRCLGASRRQVFHLILAELLLVALLVSLPGVLIGWGLQDGLVALLKGVLPAWLPEPGWLPMAVGGATGFIILMGFGLAPLLQLQQVSPLRVLRRELNPAPVATWLAYTLSLTSMTALLWYYVGNGLMALGIVMAVLVLLLVVSTSIQIGLRLTGKHAITHSLAIHWRMGVNRVLQQGSKTAAQLMAFSLIFMAMAIVLMLRTDLLDRWQDQLPEATPNYFAVNIQPSEVNEYRRFLQGHRMDSSALYPIIRGRLIEINGAEVRQAVSKEAQDHNALNRELNLTWSTGLPEGNTLLEGRWWTPGSAEGLSIEKELADQLGIQIGDNLTFMVSGYQFTQKVSSVRAVHWESFRPNFYMVFPEAVLKELPATWLNSFYLEAEHKNRLNRLIAEFPSMTLLDLDAVIGQVRRMLQQSTLAIEAMLAALLLAGLLVIASVIESSIDERLQEGALIRSLGGSKKQLLIMQAGEFVVLGLFAGLLAAAGTELCSYWLNTRVFELQWQPTLWLWISLPVTGALVLGISGWLGVRRVIRQSPSSSLKAL